MRVPKDVAADANAELVLIFEAPGIGRLTASRKLAELPMLKPPLRGLLSGAREAEEAGRHEEAVDLFEEALTCYPDRPVALNNYAWFLVTVKDADFRYAERAVTLARRAVELTNEEAGYILDTLAEALYQTGKLEEAAKYAASAAEKDPRREIRERAKRFKEELDEKRAEKE